ncbi:hypothetical protein CPJCM30710_04120 [Clostridium polyendosporum]|uniref:PDGLE domain-containing protein n=1 Tax=Clostridium polyendosporum TaxID=69208 RepID=A0A919RXW0_9CLOT|nr:PDGLE domain-containing protein [Clostridium polyendosporum]GIM27746.1 hypothetical protein CPJCM30710_04120 [Clostridium polyendosporum]
MKRKCKNLWTALGTLILLSPLGMLAPGTAWGEWGSDELIKMTGFVPKGLQKLSESWKFTLFPDYSIFTSEKGFSAQALAYIFSAVVGVALLIIFINLLGKLLKVE